MSTEPSSDVVGVVGLGYVGLPLALAIAESGYEVIGVDVDDDRIEQLQRGESYVRDVSDDSIRAYVGDGFHPTTAYDDLSAADGICICVPTPLRKTGKPDISYVYEATEELATVLSPPCTIVLESTVYPGATEEVVAATFSDAGYTIGEEIHVAFSPERMDPGNEEYGPTDIPKVIGGVTPAGTDAAVALYEPVFGEIVRVSSSIEAEMVKLLENTFRSVNIALINEIAMIANELSVDVWNVIEAAETKPFGFMPFYPGPGLGGHCIPVDPLYLSWKANQTGASTRFIELADQVNREMPGHVVRRVEQLVNDNGTPVPEADIVVCGVAYKPGVSDTRESPALDIIVELESDGATVEYHDPHVDSFVIGDTSRTSQPLDADRLRSTDCVVIVTDHDELPLDAIVEHAPVVFDTRNATVGIDAPHVHRL
jgi:UDP-N-acetyl-D-glucosamine dehydrogenase